MSSSLAPASGSTPGVAGPEFINSSEGPERADVPPISWAEFTQSYRDFMIGAGDSLVYSDTVAAVDADADGSVVCARGFP
jgi:hypothetical protein